MTAHYCTKRIIFAALKIINKPDHLNSSNDNKLRILIEGDDVRALIPQKSPIVMVDALYECYPDKAIAGLTIENDNMFCESGLFREAGIIEHIAQSAVLKARYEQYIENVAPSIGYIGSIKNFNLHFLPSAGDCLITTVTVLHIIDNVLILHGKVECDGKPVADCEMKVVAGY